MTNSGTFGIEDGHELQGKICFLQKSSSSNEDKFICLFYCFPSQILCDDDFKMIPLGKTRISMTYPLQIRETVEG